MTLAFTEFASPVGELTLFASDQGLVAILWPDDDPDRVKLEERQRDPSQPILMMAADQLADYFTGNRHIFDLPLDMRGTDFQQQVWRALLTIPFGETRSYGQLAAEIGRPTASRAVGAANGRNPLSIVAPCHRVIGSTGALTGFAGGMETKLWLLEHERGTTCLL